MKENGTLRFRCHTGHAYSAESLLAALSQGVEEALWSATRALEESALLIDQMAAHLRTSHSPADAKRFEDRAAEAHRPAKLILALVTSMPDTVPVEGH